MMPSPSTARTIQPVTVAAPAAGRVAAIGTALASFAALFDGDAKGAGAATVVAPTADPTTDRQDDAAAGNPVPLSDTALPATADAGWLAMILAGQAPTDTRTPVASAPALTPCTAGAIVTTPTVRMPVMPASALSASIPGASPPVAAPAAADPALVAAIPVPALSTPIALAPRPAVPSAPSEFAAMPTPALPTSIALVPQPAALSAPSELPAMPAVAAPSAPSSPVVPIQPAATSTPPAQTSMAPAPAEIGIPERAAASATAPASAPAPAPPIALPPSAPFPAAPAGQVFAAAIHAAERSQADEARDADLIAAPPTPSPTLAPIAPGAVAAAADRGGTSLDMRHDGWPSAMVDHIERLRDAADATDTRIRLIPDALGGIDVALSRHGGGVSVSLTAHQPATQALLVEARPHLAELAQARGIRLTDAGGGGGGGGAGGQGFADPQRFTDPQRQSKVPPPTSIAPPSATTIDDRDPADSRVA